MEHIGNGFNSVRNFVTVLKDLKEISTEELLEELKRREAVATTDEEGDKQYPFIGIVDDRGIDQLVQVDAKSFADRTSVMELRVRYNTQRNAEMFFLKMPLEMETPILKMESKDAIKFVKGLSTYKKIF